MQPRHIVLAVTMAFFWGLNFVVIAVALDDFPPLLLAGLRFVLAALPIVFLPRPRIAWGTLILIGMTLFVGQFTLLFPAMAVGMPPGLASIAAQVQAFFTIVIAATVLGERPTGRQLAGTAAAFGGIVLVGATVGTPVSRLPASPCCLARRSAGRRATSCYGARARSTCCHWYRG